MTALEPTDEKIEEYYTEEDYEYEEDFDDLGLKAIVKIGNLCYWMKYSKVNDMKGMFIFCYQLKVYFVLEKHSYV